jgi:hypothetical protein
VTDNSALLRVDAGTDGASCWIEATNVGPATVHVFDSDQMPYLLQDRDALLVLYGMHEPPANRDYWGVEIPLTKPLAPGEVVRGVVSLDPLWVHSHYGTGDEFVGLAYPTRIRTAVGWGHAPLDEAALATSNVHLVCTVWQQLALGPDLSLHSPRDRPRS